MQIDKIFNETELAIFCRQTHFSFDDCHQSEDGAIYALDEHSGQIFIGEDLFRNNVHDLDTLASVSLDDDGIILLTFKDSSSIQIKTDDGEAEAFVSRLRECIGEGEDEIALEEEIAPQEEATVPEEEFVPEEDVTAPAAEETADDDEDIVLKLSDEEYIETYSRLVNTGRSKAVAYLVSEARMSVEDANRVVDGIDGIEDMVEVVPEPDFNRDGSMSGKAVLDVVRTLKPGDRIHLEYKPLIGKVRLLEAEFLRVGVESFGQKYLTINEYACDYQSLVKDVMRDLFDYMYLGVFCEESASETDIHLKRVRVIENISNK